VPCDREEGFVKRFVAGHDGGVNRSPPLISQFNHVDVFALSQWVGDIVDLKIAARADVIHPGGVPLPPLDQTNSLGDDSITNTIRTAHQFMM